MLTGSLCKAARTLVQISKRQLADKAAVPEAMLTEFEHGIATLSETQREALVRTLEDLGALFIPEEGSLGAGVRLKFSRSVTRRIANLENEGGQARSDDVP